MSVTTAPTTDTCAQCGAPIPDNDANAGLCAICNAEELARIAGLKAAEQAETDEVDA